MDRIDDRVRAVEITAGSIRTSAVIIAAVLGLVIPLATWALTRVLPPPVAAPITAQGGTR